MVRLGISKDGGTSAWYLTAVRRLNLTLRMPFASEDGKIRPRLACMDACGDAIASFIEFFWNVQC